MNILYIGNGMHPWCSEVHFMRELQYLGHRVIHLQEPPGTGITEQTIQQIEQICDQEQVNTVWFTRTWGAVPATTALWRRLEQKGILSASTHLDLYYGLPRGSKIKGDPFWTTSIVFTADGDPEAQKWFESLGINHHHSPAGCVSDEIGRGNFRSELAHDVVFVGSPGNAYHPEWKHRGALINFLQKTYGPRFHRYGPGAERMRGQDLNDLYASAKVVVGDNLSMPGHTSYSTDRPWESVGRGAFLLQPNSPGIEEHFTDDEHLRLYEYFDFTGLKDMIDAYVTQPQERERISSAGMEHIRQTGTYKIRFGRMTALVEEMREAL